jgi:twitching motility protein PilT
VPRADGQGRLGVCEVLRTSQRTREYIANGEAEKEGRSLVDAMNDGALDGMQTFDNELERLWREGKVTKDVALSFATNTPNLALKMSGIAGTEREAQAPVRPDAKTEAPETSKKRGLGAFASVAQPAPPAPAKTPDLPGDVDVKDLME